ncbi:uncharacterized protein LOC111690268 [Lucilia cuprina]|uniref:uncharacterized protein LOC111690268 n=1 Tax=Lucilia cuprina TaxID=7375 RepID=UPI001F06B1E1|nr:uncharacterized protein LOC111690268 [Lucilia cuprina]
MVKTPKIIRTITTTKGDATYTIYDLLKEIKCRPAIWQVGHIDHAIRSIFNDNWRSIAEVLVPQFQQVDEVEQKAIILNLKNVFQKLKDDLWLFQKYKQNGDKRYRLYNFGRHMDFVLQDRGLKLEEVYSQEELNEMDLFERRFKQTYIPESLKTGNLQEEMLELIEPSDRFMETEGSQVFSNNSYEPMVYCNDGNDFASVAPSDGMYRKQKRKVKDADQAFFDSLKPWLRKMTPAQKLDFKIEFLQCLKKY